MKNFLFVSLLILFTLSEGCNFSGSKIFQRKSLHAAYGEKISTIGLQNTALGKGWFQAADKALSSPVIITLPYKEKGYFPTNESRAVGLQFTASRGEKLIIELFKNPLYSFTIFTDLWKTDESGSPTYITSLDTATNRLEYEVEKNQQLILRLQPELLQSGDYTLSISVGAALAFPVKSNKINIGSIWGDARDAGARQHEGIDIFAAKRTPVIAVADGIVIRVNENKLGGKVIWLHPMNKEYTLYYAHLDEQLVTSGSRVKVGDTIGLIGNAGNARSTPPHLHFGIYTGSGAINPLPFVNPEIKKPKDIKGFEKDFTSLHRIAKSTNEVETNTIVKVVAVNNSKVRVQLPDSSIKEVPHSAIANSTNRIKKLQLIKEADLLDAPIITASKKAVLPQSDAVDLIGAYKDYYFVEVNNENGWIPKNSTK